MSLRCGRSQQRLLRTLSQCADLRSKRTSLIPESLSEIVEIKASRLPIFVVRYHQVGDGLRPQSHNVGVVELLALHPTLKFLRPLLLAGTFFLALSECCARAYSHTVLIAFGAERFRCVESTGLINEEAARMREVPSLGSVF